MKLKKQHTHEKQNKKQFHTFNIEPCCGFQWTFSTFQDVFAIVFWLDSVNGTAIVPVCVGEMILLSVEYLHLILVPSERGIGLAELGAECDLLCPLHDLNVLQFLNELLWELDVGSGGRNTDDEACVTVIKCKGSNM